METLNSLNGELGALLSTHFQVVATHSQRQDQWYKRSYESFTSKHGARKPLIIAPRDSREEWIPEVRRFASLLASKLEAVEEQNANDITQLSSQSKLFSDQVLDKAHTRPLCLAVSGSKPLSPEMMQLAWWTTTTQSAGHKDRRLRGIKAFIACGETDPLLRLAAWPRTRPQQEFHLFSYHFRSLNSGWEDVVDDIISIMLFLGVLNVFSEDFVKEDGYKYWVPVAFYIHNSPFRPYIEAYGQKMPTTTEEIRQEMTQCTQALIAAQAFSVNSNSDPIKWESRIMDRFLYILGFEAWNRSREGAGYLGCDLNVTKGASWLRGNGDNGDIQVQTWQRRATKPIDPLKLREPKQDPTPELDEEEQRQLDELAVIESIEADYGRKRSTKYLTRHKD
ncbi:hypothetical protein FSARC_13530 [Fusarium sarcochroum]|uniref:Uncharacterized protein n=1 Tax=Fusarium sarcochroum TaxID=1208366 RepID=A0A8H4T0U0_9HYPO|nr:hypothetical protein FSARC_13530 [Fusarium sarcochroum]